MTDQAAEKHETLFKPLRSYSTSFYLIVSSLLAMVAWGAYAYYVQLTTGMGVTGMRSVVSWAFYIINFVFLIGISHAGTLISAILRVGNADWRRPITRMAEFITVMAITVGAIFPIIDLGRPDRVLNTIIFGRLQSPLTWDFICIGTYLIGSLIYLYLPLIPDIAACRDSLPEASRLRRFLYTKLSMGWYGAKEQEESLKKAIKVMAVIIIPVAVSVHSVVSWDFAMTLRVEWHSTIFAPYFVAGAIFSGVATIIIVMAVFRRSYHLESYIKLKHFLYLAYLMLALDIAMLYFTISEFLVAGYGAESLDVTYLSLLLTGPYAAYFWFMIVGGLLVPVFLVAFPRTRQVKWLVVAAVLVDAGMWLERYLIVVPVLSVPQLPYALGQYTPSWVEISIVVGGFAGFALLLLVFSRLFPVVSIWEIRESGEATLPSLPSSAAMTMTAPEENRGNSRREFLKLSALASMGLAFGVTTTRLGSEAVSALQGQNEAATVERAVPLSNLGESVSLDEAKSMAPFAILTPQHLPEGSALKDVRVADGGKVVSLLYTNPRLTPLSIYTSDVAVAVLLSSDPLQSSPPVYLPSGFTNVSINGSQGFAREPVVQGFAGVVEPGQLQWWRDAARCSIFANLSLDDLKVIAESMEAK